MDSSKPAHRDLDSTDSLTSDGRRRAARHETSARLLIVIDTPQFSGTADNLSENGVFFFSNEQVRVLVHVDDNGVEKRYAGKIVRIQQMNEQETGFAIEFDVT